MGSRFQGDKIRRETSKMGRVGGGKRPNEDLLKWKKEEEKQEEGV